MNAKLVATTVEPQPEARKHIFDLVTTPSTVLEKISNSNSRSPGIAVFTDCSNLAVEPHQAVLQNFVYTLCEQLRDELDAYGLSSVEVKNYAPLMLTASKSLEKARSAFENIIIHLVIKIRHRIQPLRFPSRVQIRLSSFDQTTLGGYIQRNFDHWGLEPWILQTEYQCDYVALKNGVIPVTVILGDYTNLTELSGIEKLLPKARTALTRALTSYLYPLYAPPKPSPQFSNFDPSKNYADAEEVPFK